MPSEALKVLILNQFAWPDAAATAQLLDDVTRALGSRSDVSVTVVSGSQSYRHRNARDAPPARIVRIPGLPAGRSRYGRVLGWLTYYFGVLTYCLVGPKHDVVISMTTPPFLSLIGRISQKVRGTRHVIWEMDVYPDIAEAAGLFRRARWAYRKCRSLANRLRGTADAVLVLGSCMKQRLIRQGVPETRVVVCENWAPFSAHHSPFAELPMKPLRLLYSGNLGVAHDIETLRQSLAEVSKLPEAESRFHITIAADGARRRELEEWCAAQGVKVAQFRPLVELEELSAHLEACHLGLVTQTPESIGCVVPSKFYGLLAAGRPVLYIGPRESEVAHVIRQMQCGFHIQPGDAQGLLRLLLHLEANPEEISAAAERAAFLGATAYSTSAGVARIQAALAPVFVNANVVANPELNVSYTG